MQHLSETLELIRFSIYFSFAFTGGCIFYFVIKQIIIFFIKRKKNLEYERRKLSQITDNSIRIDAIEEYLIKQSKGKFKPYQPYNE